jgi:nucleotide-binding universal stress UspA family protein
MAQLKVMVAVRDSATVDGLISLSCQLAQVMKAELMILHVVAVPLLTPLEATDETIDHSGKELLAQAQRVAEKLAQPATIELLRAREVGEAIVGVAQEQAIDLLILGHHKPHPHALGESLLGGVVRYVAHHAPCRVIVQIPAPDAA